jgi:hypothetical protein
VSDSRALEPWLRGPLPGIAGLLQPAAHALVASLEDVERAVGDLGDALAWRDPGNAASVGYHLLHLSGSTDRLLTYARDEPLSEQQQMQLQREKAPGDPPPRLDALLAGWRLTVDRALTQLARITDDQLLQPRFVGRGRLPSTVIGLVFHAAEHAQRHTGQLIATARIVRATQGRDAREE